MGELGAPVTPAKRVRVSRKSDAHNPRFPWGVICPHCTHLRMGGGWPTWASAMRNAERHLREYHGLTTEQEL